MLLAEAPVGDLVRAQVHGHVLAEQALEVGAAVEVHDVAYDVDGGVERRLGLHVHVAAWRLGAVLTALVLQLVARRQLGPRQAPAERVARRVHLEEHQHAVPHAVAHERVQVGRGVVHARVGAVLGKFGVRRRHEGEGGRVDQVEV